MDNITIFTFQGANLLLITFENKSVQVFEEANGHFCYEFNFYDNSSDDIINDIMT